VLFGCRALRGVPQCRISIRQASFESFLRRRGVAKLCDQHSFALCKMLDSCGSFRGAILAGLLDRSHRIVHPLLERIARANGLREPGRQLRMLLPEFVCGRRCVGQSLLLGHLMRHIGLSQLCFESAALSRFVREGRLQFGLPPGEMQRSLLLGRRALLGVSERRVSVGKLLLEFLPGR
jgi:hypothetical protein